MVQCVSLYVNPQWSYLPYMSKLWRNLETSYLHLGNKQCCGTTMTRRSLSEEFLMEPESVPEVKPSSPVRFTRTTKMFCRDLLLHWEAQWAVWSSLDAGSGTVNTLTVRKCKGSLRNNVASVWVTSPTASLLAVISLFVNCVALYIRHHM